MTEDMDNLQEIPTPGDRVTGEYGETRTVVYVDPCPAVKGGYWIGFTRSAPWGKRKQVWSCLLPQWQRWASAGSGEGVSA